MQLATRTTSERALLERLARERIKDFRVLRKAERHAAAIYLGVYAVECLLKARICKNLDLDALPVTYRSHDLMALLLHSGLHKKIESEREVFYSLRKLDALWNPADEERSVRYIHDPGRYGKTAANDVLVWLTHRTKGVVSWLKKQQ